MSEEIESLKGDVHRINNRLDNMDAALTKIVKRLDGLNTVRAVILLSIAIIFACLM